MLKIAICDDEKIFYNDLNNLLNEYSKLRGEAIVTTYFSSGHDLLNSTMQFDIVFMDYQMNGLDGMETSRVLRTRDKNVTIIFLTSFPQIVFQSFEVNTFRFLLKPVKKKELFDAIDAYVQSINVDDFLLLKTNNGTMKIRISDIIYVVAQSKHCIIRTVDDTFECLKYLKVVEGMLPSDTFVRVHKSCVVNFNHIQNHDSESVYFENGERAVLGRKYLVDFKKAFHTYIIQNSKI